jgi:murein DD-endopeptidase MepM/ murein hydrolase activator NlpD
MRRLLKSGAVLVLILVLAAPALAEVSQDDVDSAARKLEQLRQQSDALVAQYEDAWARSELLADQVQSLTDLVSTSQVDIGIAERRLQDRAVEMYMNGTGSEIFTAYVLSGGPGAGIGYLEETAAADRQLVDDLSALRQSYQHQLDDLEAARSEQDRVTGDMQALADQVLQQMGPAQAAYDALKETRALQLAEAEATRKAAEEEAARKAAAATSTTTTVAETTTPPPTTPAAETTTTVAKTTTTVADTTTSTAAETTTTVTDTTTSTAAETTTTVPGSIGGQVCPIDGFTSFSDTFGAARSGGRTHEGVDMIAERWTHIVAIESGTIYQLKEGGLGGTTIWLHSDSGDSYYYAHLEAWADGLSEGQHVDAGELIGYVGTSGNAPDWLPHLHFEYHPDHGPAVDPYPLVKSLCG